MRFVQFLNNGGAAALAVPTARAHMQNPEQARLTDLDSTTACLRAAHPRHTESVSELSAIAALVVPLAVASLAARITM